MVAEPLLWQKKREVAVYIYICVRREVGSSADMMVYCSILGIIWASAWAPDSSLAPYGWAPEACLGWAGSDWYWADRVSRPQRIAPPTVYSRQCYISHHTFKNMLNVVKPHVCSKAGNSLPLQYKVSLTKLGKCSVVPSSPLYRQENQM